MEATLTPEMLGLAKRVSESNRKTKSNRSGWCGDKNHARKKKTRKKMEKASRRLMRHVNGRTKKR